MDPGQMDWWEAFNEVEPIGLRELHLLVAQVVQQVAASCGKELKLKELCPWMDRE